MKLEDIEAPPCSCPQCHQAGVTDKPLRRDPRTGAMLHGYSLRKWYEARDEFFRLAKEHGPKEMPR